MLSVAVAPADKALGARSKTWRALEPQPRARPQLRVHVYAHTKLRSHQESLPGAAIAGYDERTGCVRGTFWHRAQAMQKCTRCLLAATAKSGIPRRADGGAGSQSTSSKKKGRMLSCPMHQDPEYPNYSEFSGGPLNLLLTNYHHLRWLH